MGLMQGQFRKACRLPPSKCSFWGPPTETDVDVFLSQGRSGPEHQALVAALASLNAPNADDKAQQDLSVEAIEKLSRALGKAVARCWSDLPPEIQHDLFEAAVTSE